jgi:hypothetical protein
MKTQTSFSESYYSWALRRNTVLSIALFFNALAVCNPVHAQNMQTPTTRIFTPSGIQLRQWTYALQLIAARCNEKTKAAAQQVFDDVVAFRLKQQRFPESVEDLKNHSDGKPKSSMPPANPFADSTIVSKEVRQELINAGSTPSDFCKIVIESDPFVTGGFPLTLKNVKLNPDRSEPGTIIVKHNANNYLAVWCMDLTMSPLVDQQTQQPYLLFKDFSTLNE